MLKQNSVSLCNSVFEKIFHQYFKSLTFKDLQYVHITNQNKKGVS